MKKYYSEPELEIRSYTLCQGTVLTTSTPEIGDGSGTDLGDDDKYDVFA